jgi:hypothetical protein
MTIKSPYTRRDIADMQPEVLGRYHDLVMTNDISGYERLLDEYQPHITTAERQDLIEDFKRLAEIALRKRWHLPKSH